MGIRDALKKREEEKEQRKAAAEQNDLPEGVSRYIKNEELKGEGRTFIILDDPDNWYVYFVHEDTQFKPYAKFIQKHTCLHSPRVAGISEEDFARFDKRNGDVCPSCKAKAKRVFYSMIRLYDVEYGTWRIFDTKGFHLNSLISAYDGIEEAAREFQPDYSLVLGGVRLKKHDKTYTFVKTKVNDADIEKAKRFLVEKPDYAELANFRPFDEVVKIVMEADDEHVDKSAIAHLVSAGSSEQNNEEIDAKPVDNKGVNPDDLPF